MEGARPPAPAPLPRAAALSAGWAAACARGRVPSAAAAAAAVGVRGDGHPAAAHGAALPRARGARLLLAGAPRLAARRLRRAVPALWLRLRLRRRALLQALQRGEQGARDLAHRHGLPGRVCSHLLRPQHPHLDPPVLGRRPDRHPGPPRPPAPRQTTPAARAGRPQGSARGRRAAGGGGSLR